MTFITIHINQHSKINWYLRFKIERVRERVLLEAFGYVVLVEHPNSHITYIPLKSRFSRMIKLCIKK